MLTARGKISVTKDRVSCDLSRDFCRYYQWLIHRSFPNLEGGLFLPRHGCHITLAQPNFHIVDFRKAKFFHGEVVEFSYDPRRIRIGGLKKGFVGFYLSINSKRLETIRREVSRAKNKGDKKDSLHLTICSSKYLLKQNE
jgi:hypothetical protein